MQKKEAKKDKVIEQDMVYVANKGNETALFFFFFKQKTAYEIFTCWSSDVCSSDLNMGLLDLGDDNAAFEKHGCRQHEDGGVDEQRSEERRVGKECRSRWSPYN